MTILGIETSMPCAKCGVTQWNFRGKCKSCARVASATYRVKNRRVENHVARNCKCCGKEFASLKQPNPRLYCSVECRPRYLIENISTEMREKGLKKRALDGWLTGADNPNFKDAKLKSHCKFCSVEFSFYKWEKKAGKFCSIPCRISFGKAHPQSRTTEYAKRVNSNISRAIRGSLRDGKGRIGWQSLVGYTLAELVVAIEAKFKPGMSWDNYGVHGWHIDHIRPKSHFQYEKVSDSEFSKCWALSNLQPLWAVDNWKKCDLKNKNKGQYA